MTAMLLLMSVIAHATGITDRMSLIEAIDTVRQGGVDITYSSRLVEPWMRVRTTPTETDPTEALREALSVYSLELERGPQGQWLIVKGEASEQTVLAETLKDGPSPGSETVFEPRLDEVIIVASRYALFDQHAGSGQFLTGDEIRLLPHIADDVFRAFHRLPGVAATDFSAPFHLRGGAPDENKVMLDGLELFEPYHMRTLFSPLSIVDPGIIDNVSVMSGGFTADYGNHMSGVIDIKTRWASTDPVYEMGVSFVNAFVRGSGAWGVSGAFQFAARRGYLDLLADAASVGSEEFDPRYSDIYAKAGFSVSDTTRIDAHVLLASDDVAYANTDEGEQGNTDGSMRYAWVTFDSDLNDDLRWINVLSTGSTSTRDRGVSDNWPGENIDRFYDRDVSVSGLQSDLTLNVSDAQVWMFGLRYRHLDADFVYSIDSTRRSDFFNGGVPLEIQRDITTARDGDELGLYARYRFKPTPYSTWEAGLRWDRQTWNTADDDTQISPRVNARFELGERSELRAGWGYYYQPQGIQGLQVEDGVTEYSPAARAEHRVVGFHHNFESGLNLQADVYQKLYSDLIPRFENALDTFDYAPESDFDRVRIDAMSAEAIGVEITLRNRRQRGLDWWLNYTWSKADDLIEGVEVPRSWDQRHAVTGNLSWRGEKWTLNLVGRYHSGWPRTPLLVTPILDAGGALIALDGDLSRYNQTSYDDYFRVDVRLSRMVNLDHGSFQYYFEVFNLLNTENQCCVSGHDLDFGETLLAIPNFDAYVPFFPSFGFVWTFGPGAH